MFGRQNETPSEEFLPDPCFIPNKLTESLHQVCLQIVGHQRLRELGEEGLHCSCNSIDGVVFLHQVQIVVWPEKETLGEIHNKYMNTSAGL